MRAEDDFDSWLRARQYAPTTRRMYRHYAARLDGFTDAQTCTVTDLTGFLETLPSTAPSRMAARKSLVCYLRHLERDPNPAEALP